MAVEVFLEMIGTWNSSVMLDTWGWHHPLGQERCGAAEVRSHSRGEASSAPLHVLPLRNFRLPVGWRVMELPDSETSATLS